MAEDGAVKTAILLLALGEEVAVNVMKQLDQNEVQRVGTALATLNKIDTETVVNVMNQFSVAASTQSILGRDTDSFATLVMNRVLGPEVASALLSRIMETRETSGIESLRWMEAQTVAQLIEGEHPQIIATILIHLEAEQCSRILQHFTHELRTDVMLRVATVDGVTPLALKELNDVLANLLTMNETLNKRRVGGTRVAAEIMNNLGGDLEQELMIGLKAADDSLAQKITDEMFTFDDIVDVEDQSIQLLLREIPSNSVLLALKGSTTRIKEKFFNNMSTRAAALMTEDLQNMGPVKRIDVEKQRKEIMQIVRKMANEGTITMIEKNGGDQYVA
jgi:flagellar motor switch protein FliG